MTQLVCPEAVGTELERVATALGGHGYLYTYGEDLRRYLETDGEAAMFIVFKDEAGNLAGWLRLILAHLEEQWRWHWRDSTGCHGVVVAGSRAILGLVDKYRRGSAMAGNTYKMKITRRRKYNTQIEDEESNKVEAAQAGVDRWALEDTNWQEKERFNARARAKMMRGLFGRHWRLAWRLDETLSVALLTLCVMWVLAMVQGWHQVALGTLGLGFVTLALHRQWRLEVNLAVFYRYRQHLKKCDCQKCTELRQADVFEDGFASEQLKNVDGAQVRVVWRVALLTGAAWAIFGWLWIEKLTESARPVWASMAILVAIGLATVVAGLFGLLVRSRRLALAANLPFSILLGSVVAAIVDGMAGLDGAVATTVMSIIAFGMFTWCRIVIRDFLLVDIRKQPSWAAQIGYFLGDRLMAEACHSMLACHLHELAETTDLRARMWLRLENGVAWSVCFSNILLEKLSRRVSTW